MNNTSPIHLHRLLRPGMGLVLGFLFAVLALSGIAAEQSYLVKRGDTLYGIARKFGVSLSELTDRNDLSKSGHIYAGQRLTIPGPQRSGKSVDLPDSIERAIRRAPVKPGRWRYVVIHHSGTPSGTVKGMDRYHREHRHMENGLAYHFVIGNGHGMRDGQVVAAPRWTRQLDGGHLASEAQNAVAIGICLVGDFEHSAPTAKQIRSLRALVKLLRQRCHLPLSAVKTHREINVIATRCPGSRFNAKGFRDSLQ